MKIETPETFTQIPRGKPEGGYLFLGKKLRRGKFLKWLRRTHAWIGLWGAALGLLFGMTGILLNHRAIMKIPAAQVRENTVQLALPNPLPANAEAMSQWIQSELGLTGKNGKVKVEKAKKVAWGDRSVTQPERWQINFVTPKKSIQAEYWVGNSLISVKHSDNNAFAMLTRLHMASGVDAAWILLTDTLAGGLILLAITGTLLWTRLHGPRLAAAGLASGSLSLVILFAWQAM